MFSQNRKPRKNGNPRPGRTSTPPPAPTPIPPSAWTTANLAFTPDSTQAQILDHSSRRLMLCCARQWGKSTLAAAKALYTAVHQPNSLTIIGAPTERQSGELVNKAKSFAQTLNLRIKSGRAARQSPVLENGSRILGLPGSSATATSTPEAAANTNMTTWQSPCAWPPGEQRWPCPSSSASTNPMPPDLRSAPSRPGPPNLKMTTPAQTPKSPLALQLQ